ncbi:MAG: hypothetical protein SPL96_01485 [Bacteroidales bacterium]|nr:hypothetical protein [Bacteroidales bacterium]
MKKITLIIAAMLAMAPIHAATSDTAASDAAPNTPQQATATTSDDNGGNIELSHPFKNDEARTKHWTVEPSGVYVGMGVKHSWDAINNSVEAGMLNVLGLNYNSLHGQNLSLGVGIHHRSYSMKRPVMLVRDDYSDAVIMSTYPEHDVDKIKRRSSNLNMWSMQFPLMFRQRIKAKLEIGIAGILNWNAFARVDNHYEISKVEHDTRYKGLNQRKISFDLMGNLTWNGVGLYCRYSPGKFFKDGHGPEIKNTWTLGLVVGL